MTRKQAYERYYDAVYRLNQSSPPHFLTDHQEKEYLAEVSAELMRRRDALITEETKGEM